MPASLFKHKPEQCLVGHSPAPGQAADGRMETLHRAPAREAAAEGRGIGHLLICCGSWDDELRRTTFYEPPHDIRHRQAGPWLVS